jgi:hypothetical protein
VARIAAEARLELRVSTIVMAGLDPAIHDKRRPGAIPAFFLRSLRANGSRECAADDTLRDEAIHLSVSLRYGLLRLARMTV